MFDSIPLGHFDVRGNIICWCVCFCALYAWRARRVANTNTKYEKLSSACKSKNYLYLIKKI